MELLSHSALLLLACAGFLLHITAADLHCQGNRGGIPDKESALLVKQSFEKLISGIDIQASYQDGVSFTAAVNHSSGNSYSVTRLLYWDSTRCIPGTDVLSSKKSKAIKNGFSDFFAFGGGFQPKHGYGWGTMVSTNFIIDYYTVDRTRLVNPRAGDRLSQYCTGLNETSKHHKHNCNPRVSNLVSGNNGVFSVLRAGERLVAPNKLFYVEMQEDCNLVVYEEYLSTAIWASNTNGKGTNCYAVLREDLNLVVSNDVPAKLWESYPHSKLAKNSTLVSSPATGVLTMQNDGNLVVYATDLSVNPIWASKTSEAANAALIKG